MAKVDKAFAVQQRRLKEMGQALDHLAVSAKKYELDVVSYFVKQEEGDKFSPLARRAERDVEP